MPLKARLHLQHNGDGLEGGLELEAGVAHIDLSTGVEWGQAREGAFVEDVIAGIVGDLGC